MELLSIIWSFDYCVHFIETRQGATWASGGAEGLRCSQTEKCCSSGRAETLLQSLKSFSGKQCNSNDATIRRYFDRF